MYVRVQYYRSLFVRRMQIAHLPRTRRRLRQLVLYDEARDCSFLSMRQHFLCYNSATSDSFDEGIRSSLYRRHVVIIIANLFGTFTRELIYVAASKRGDFPARHHLSAQRNGE